MAAKLRIKDGNPVWLSMAIIPSKDTVVSPNSSPSLATISVSSNNVFVYVKVENIGAVDLGGCSCTALGPWTAPVFFNGFLANPNATASESKGGVTFTANSNGNTLSGGGINFQFGIANTGRRAWAFSADGRFFAYVSTANGPDWTLTIVALQNITRSNGTTLAKGQSVSSNGLYAGTNPVQYWNNSNFGWAGKAVLNNGAYAGGSGFVAGLLCPEAPIPSSWGNLFPDFPGQIDWAFRISPCGSTVAFCPQKLNNSAPPQDFFLVSTEIAQVVPFRKNNGSTSISTTGVNVGLNTTAHTANGVTVNTGNGTTVTVDDPDCTLIGGGITVRVDRVKGSTLPTANLGVLAIGTAAIGKLAAGQSAWVQVPNTNGWANQSEKHWCLLAQTYTSDLTTIPRPWDGQAVQPPPFPITLDNCAQRNIEINP